MSRPSATAVNLINPPPNLPNSTRTTEAGVYTSNSLPSATTHTAEANGFEISTLGPFRLDVNQTVREDLQPEGGRITSICSTWDISIRKDL